MAHQPTPISDTPADPMRGEFCT